MKKNPDSNPDPVARREALASDLERFISSGRKIEQIPSGVSSHGPQGPVKTLRTQNNAKTPPTPLVPESAPVSDPKAAS